MMENEIDSLFDEVLETIEPTDNGKTDNSYSEIVENDLGECYDQEELLELRKLVASANNLIQTGELSEHNALETIQGVYGNYLKRRDMEEAINEGLKPSDVSDEAFEFYLQNLGKYSIKQCCEITDHFLKGLFEGVETKQEKRKQRRRTDAFLAGFDSV